MRGHPRHIPITVAPGRVADTLLPLDERDRIALGSQPGAFADFRVRVFPSRHSLEVFLRNQTIWSALVKDEVAANMLLHPAYQKSKFDAAAYAKLCHELGRD